MTKVFDVAKEFIKLNDGPVESVKLQKLCFYSLGWYGRVTGSPLFSERFYAMQHGPVVGELLSAHAGRTKVDLPMIEEQIEVRDGESDPLTPYETELIRSVWDYYGDIDTWDLVDISHEEAVWSQSWDCRPEGSKRGDMSTEEIVDYFVQRPLEDVESLQLPPAMLFTESADFLSSLEEADAPVPADFIGAIRDLMNAA